MIYSRADKVGNYLAHYNIKGFSSNKNTQVTNFVLTNLHTGSDQNLETLNPLYNVLTNFEGNFDFLENAITNLSSTFKDMMFDDPSTATQFHDYYIDSDYYKRYGTLEHEAGLKWSSEYFSYLELKDIEIIKTLSGFKDNEIVSVHGNFFKMDDDTLRFMFKPTTPIIENINEVFFAESYVLTLNGQQYPMYYIIYTANGSDEVMYEWSNLLVNSITNHGTVTISLTQLFGATQPTILDDMRTLNGFNEDWFIVNNIFTCAIFRNSPEGIIRYIPINYTVQFFNIVFNNMSMDLAIGYRPAEKPDGTLVHLPHVYYPSQEDAQISDDYDRGVENVYKEQRIIPQSDMEHVEFLNQLIGLSSTAAYFNDVLFNIDDTEFQFPVYLTSEDSNFSPMPFDTQHSDERFIGTAVSNAGNEE